jgi:flavorubredoxin
MMLWAEATVMRAVIVYESMFGSTRAITHAIAGGLRAAMPVDVVAIEDAPGALGVVPEGVSLLIVGAPSHTPGLSTPKSRAAAAGRASRPMAVADVGLREWLAALPTASNRLRNVLAFETRLRVRAMPGSASKAAAKRLRKRGYRMLWPVQTFYVADLTGTLAEGELQRAHMWGRWLGVGRKTEASR